jgi:cell division protein FtsA
MLSLVHDELKRAGFAALIPAGIVLTGGGARLKGLIEIADHIFSLPVRIAAPRGLAGLPEEFAQPEYSASAGLLLYGARARRQTAARPTGLVGKLKAMFAGQ